MMIRPPSPALCHTRQIDINVIISAARASRAGGRGRRRRAWLSLGEVRCHVASSRVVGGRQSPLTAATAAAAAAAELHQLD